VDWTEYCVKWTECDQEMVWCGLSAINTYGVDECDEYMVWRGLSAINAWCGVD